MPWPEHRRWRWTALPLAPTSRWTPVTGHRWRPSLTRWLDAGYVSATSGRVLTCAGNDRSQVEPVRGTITRVVFLESGRTPLEEPDSASVVPASCMREGDADLGETLPQIAFFARTSLPASLKDLMRSKGPALSYQTPGHVQGLRRRQWLLRNRLDAGRPVRQRPAKSVTRPFLARTTGSVAVSIGGHGWLLPECPRTIPNVIRPMVEVCSRTSATAGALDRDDERSVRCRSREGGTLGERTASR